MARKGNSDLERCAAWSAAVLATAAFIEIVAAWFCVVSPRSGNASDTASDVVFVACFGGLADFFSPLLIAVARDLEMRRTEVVARISLYAIFLAMVIGCLGRLLTR